MFEGSFLFNPIIQCLDHPRNPISHLCMDPSCRQNPFLCQQCLKIPNVKQKHYGHDLHLKPVHQTLQQIAQTLKLSKKPVQNLYKSLVVSTLSPTSSNNQNLNSTLTESNTPNLIKYQQQKQQHYQSVRKHIQSIKYELSEEVRQLVHRFQQTLESQLKNTHKQLEKYYQNYQQHFETFSHKIAPIVSINKQLKYFNRVQNIAIKLMNETDSEQRSKWFIDVKKAVVAASKVLNDSQVQMDKLKKISMKTNDLMDMLPRMRGVDYEANIKRIISQCTKQIFQQAVQFGENYQSFENHHYNNKYGSMGDILPHNKSLSSIHKSHSMQQNDTSSQYGKATYEFFRQRF